MHQGTFSVPQEDIVLVRSTDRIWLSVRRLSVKFLSICILFACAAVAAAPGEPSASYFVATTGKDSNPGTQSAPWRTIQHAADSAHAGSTVNVRGGVYEELVRINVSGNAGGFITFRSYPHEIAVLDA